MAAKKSEKEKLTGFEQAVEQADIENTPLVRTLRREVKKLQRVVMAEHTGEDTILHAVKEAYRLEGEKEFIPPSAPKAYDKKAHVEIPIAVLSDTQIGKITKTYNTSVARERLMQYAQKVVLLSRIHREYANVDELHVYWIGDMVEGETIFPTQPFLIDSSVLKQAVVNVPTILAEMVFFWLGHFKKIKIFTVPGNHGRSGKKHDATHPETNWDNVSYHVAKLMILGMDGNRIDAEGKKVSDRVEINVSESFWNMDRIGKWGYLMIHGDQVSGGFAGFPWYGVTRFAQKLARNHEIPPWDYLFLGHFHSPTNWTVNDLEIFANGTTESSNDFALANMGAAGFPCQWLCFVSPKRGMLSNYKIYLDEAGRVPHVERMSKLAKEKM